MANNYVDELEILGEILDIHDKRLTQSDVQNVKDLPFKPIPAITMGRNDHVIFVGKDNKAEYNSINTALSVLYSRFPELTQSMNNPIMCAIVILSGTYEEHIDLASYSGICFYGLGDVTITSNEGYPACTLNGYGRNHFYNIKFINTNSINAYAYHYEAGGVSHSNLALDTKFTNCTFISGTNGGVGIGSGNRYTNLWFDNCVFSGVDRDVYLHNSTYDGSTDNYIRFTNCIAGIVRVEDSAHINANRNSVLNLLFNNNQFRKMDYYGGNQGTWANMHLPYVPIDETNIVLGYENNGNTGVSFNAYERRKQIEGYYVKGDKGNWSNYAYNIYCEKASAYDWSIFQAIASDGTNIKPNLSLVVNTGGNNITINDTSNHGVGGLTNMVLIGNPKAWF